MLSDDVSTPNSQGRLQNLNNAILTHRAQHDAENEQRSGVMENKIKTLDDKILRSAISEDEKMKANFPEIATLPSHVDSSD